MFKLSRWLSKMCIKRLARVTGFWLVVASQLAFNNYTLADEIVIDDWQQMSFADELFEIGDFDRAILEYNRLVHIFPQSPLLPVATLKAALSYYYKGESKLGLKYLDYKLSTVDDKRLLTALTYQKAIFLLEYEYQAPFLIRQGSIEEAMSTLSGLKDTNLLNMDLDGFTKEWHNRKLVGKKSPILAGLLSAVLPGAGSVYTKRYTEGFYSVVLTALSIWATVEAASTKSVLHQLFPFFIITSAGFYAGSIYTAVNSAYIYNSDLELQYLNKLRDSYNIWMGELKF